MTPLASVAMLEKLALLKIALCNAPVLSNVSSCRISKTSPSTLAPLCSAVVKRSNCVFIVYSDDTSLLSWWFGTNCKRSLSRRKHNYLLLSFKLRVIYGNLIYMSIAIVIRLWHLIIYIVLLHFQIFFSTFTRSFKIHRSQF